VGIAVMALLPIFLLYPSPQPVEAQCGSSASSCKNCHEVQAQDPVNDKGEWHTAHAFGDFCEFCHAGNVQAKAKDESHVGMVDPLSDVKASCQSCHPQDYADLAQTYATALGVTVGAGSAPSTEAAGASSATNTVTGTVSETVQSGNPVQGATLDLSQVTAPGAMLVDYNALYNGAAEPSLPQPINWGNIIFLILDVGLLIVLVLTVVFREHLVARFRQLREMRFEPGMSLNAAMAGGGQMDVSTAPISSTAVAQNPALARLLPRLINASPVLLAALDQLLDEGEIAEEVLVALTNIDLRMVEEFKSLSKRDRELLVALTNDFS